MAIQIFMSVACKLLFIIGKNAVSGSDIVEKQFFLTDNELYQIVLLCSCICCNFLGNKQEVLLSQQPMCISLADFFTDRKKLISFILTCLVLTNDSRIYIFFLCTVAFSLVEIHHTSCQVSYF